MVAPVMMMLIDLIASAHQDLLATGVSMRLMNASLILVSMEVIVLMLLMHTVALAHLVTLVGIVKQTLMIVKVDLVGMVGSALI